MNKKILFSVCFYILSFFILSCASSPLNSGRANEDFQLPKYQVHRLSNGAEVLVISDKRLPTVNFALFSKVGSRLDAPKQSGITYLMASLFEKGAGRFNATQIADAIGHLGADFDASVDSDYSSFTISGLSKDQNELLSWFSTLLLQPNFNEVEIERLKKQTIAVIRRGFDDPDDFADRAFDRLMMGQHPYGASVYGAIKDIESLNRAKVIEHYKKYFSPKNSTFAVVGDFQPETLEKMKSIFGSWPIDNASDLPPLESPKFETLSRVTLVERKDLAQAQIRFGHSGIRRNDPDFLALRVASTILGGSFSSRLMNRVRTQKGLTYGISAGFSPGLVEGPFSISTFTRFDKVNETIQETMNVLNEFKTKGVTQDEVRIAVAFLKGAFPRAFETPEMLASQLLTLRLYGIPDSYLATYLNEISQLSAGDINRVIKKHFKPEQMQIMVYGTADLKSQLEAQLNFNVKNYNEFIF